MDLLNLARVQWDRATAIGCSLLGLLVLVVGYFGISGTEFVAAQMPYIISGGLTGIFLLGIGAMLWLSADLRDEWRELRQLRRSLDQHTQALQASRVSVTTDGVEDKVEVPSSRSPRVRRTRADNAAIDR